MCEHEPVHVHREKVKVNMPTPALVRSARGSIPRSVQVCVTRPRPHPCDALCTWLPALASSHTPWHQSRQLEKNAPASVFPPSKQGPLPPSFLFSLQTEVFLMVSTAFIQARKLPPPAHPSSILAVLRRGRQPLAGADECASRGKLVFPGRGRVESKSTFYGQSIICVSTATNYFSLLSISYNLQSCKIAQRR